MTPEELKLFKQDQPKYKIKATNEAVEISWLEKVVFVYQERLKKLSEISDFADFFFQDKLNYDKELLRWKDMPDNEIADSLKKTEKNLETVKEGEWTKENLESSLMPITDVSDKGKILWPLRVALTGKKASASPFDVAVILGKEKTIKRIKEAMKRL